MKNSFLFTACLLCITLKTAAQQHNNFKMSAGIDAAYTSSDLLLFWGTGLGVSVQPEYFFSKKVSVTFTAGYNIFFGVSILGGYKQPSLHVVPVRAGLRYYFTEKFYVAGQAGIGMLSGGGEGASFLKLKGNYFSYSPQLGYQFTINNKKRIDIAVKYESYSKSPNTFSDGGIRAAYIF